MERLERYLKGEWQGRKKGAPYEGSFFGMERLSF
jgi:hypothetical protein